MGRGHGGSGWLCDGKPEDGFPVTLIGGGHQAIEAGEKIHGSTFKQDPLHLTEGLGGQYPGRPLRPAAGALAGAGLAVEEKGNEAVAGARSLQLFADPVRAATHFGFFPWIVRCFV
jgi:hypothetical protein